MVIIFCYPTIRHVEESINKNCQFMRKIYQHTHTHIHTTYKQTSYQMCIMKAEILFVDHIWWDFIYKIKINL